MAEAAPFQEARKTLDSLRSACQWAELDGTWGYARARASELCWQRENPLTMAASTAFVGHAADEKGNEVSRTGDANEQVAGGLAQFGESMKLRPDSSQGEYMPISAQCEVLEEGRKDGAAIQIVAGGKPIVNETLTTSMSRGLCLVPNGGSTPFVNTTCKQGQPTSANGAQNVGDGSKFNTAMSVLVAPISHKVYGTPGTLKATEEPRPGVPGILDLADQSLSNTGLDLDNALPIVDGLKRPQSDQLTDQSEHLCGTKGPVAGTIRIADSGVYCLCRGGDDGGVMVSCDSCSEWFHARW